jgi:hypothetical protein
MDSSVLYVGIYIAEQSRCHYRRSRESRNDGVVALQYLFQRLAEIVDGAIDVVKLVQAE